MKCLFVVRLLFSSLVPATVIIAYPVFVFVCDFSSDDRECARSEHAVAVFGATLAVCLPAAVVFVAGWWRSEVSIKNVSANQTNALRRFRLAMTIVLVLSLATILSPLTVGFAAFPLLVATAGTWTLVEGALLFRGNVAGKTYADMTDNQLGRAHSLWSERIAESTGWAALLFATEQVDRIAHEVARRSSGLTSDGSDSRVVPPGADSPGGT